MVDDIDNDKVTVRISDQVLHRAVGDEAVILNLESEKYIGLDAIGQRMVEALDDAPSVQAAIDALVDEYDVERERIASDMSDLIDGLVERGVVVVTRSA